MSTFPQNSAVVLVHGAWADGSCWSHVILPLQRQGLQVSCAPIPLTSLTDDVAALSRALERTSGPVVLAGHAYGGAVIGAIRDVRIKSFVCVAALAPDEGEAVAKVFYRDEPHPNAPKLALVHPRENSKDRGTKDSARPAPRTKLVIDAPPRGRSRAGVDGNSLHWVSPLTATPSRNSATI